VLQKVAAMAPRLVELYALLSREQLDLRLTPLGGGAINMHWLATHSGHELGVCDEYGKIYRVTDSVEGA